MIKDYGNQKLPRFRAGQPLLDQVTAERLNDICAMIEASRIQNGVGYTMNRSAGGTALSVLDSGPLKNAKAWRVSFGEEFSKMEESMLAVYIAKDDEVLPDMYFPEPSIIRGNIEAFLLIEKFFQKTEIFCGMKMMDLGMSYLLQKPCETAAERSQTAFIRFISTWEKKGTISRYILANTRKNPKAESLHSQFPDPQAQTEGTVKTGETERTEKKARKETKGIRVIKETREIKARREKKVIREI